MVTFAASIACSTACVACLGATDPKRRGKRGTLRSRLARLRWACLIGGLAPGLWLLVQQEGAYFLMWLGYVAVFGWSVALVLQKRGSGGEH